MFDVVVIGGGPAGLQATLTLARGQRRVALVDGGAPRNQRAVQVHNFVSRDGIPPKDFRAESRRQLEGYGVRLVQGLVRGVHGEPDGFTVDVDDDTRLEARRIVVALGVRDVLPDWSGLAALWGDTIFQCPYCHGHEVRGTRWAVYADSPHMPQLALLARA